MEHSPVTTKMVANYDKENRSGVLFEVSCFEKGYFDKITTRLVCFQVTSLYAAIQNFKDNLN